MIKYDKLDIPRNLANFIWDFKIGGNIIYNFKILFLVYKNKNDANYVDRQCYNKLIVILLVSIIEAILIDLLKRLDCTVNDVPEKISLDEINNIKMKISKSKKLKNFEDFITGELVRYYVMKKYDFSEIVQLCRDHNLLFSENKSDINNIYTYLIEFAYLRNRIHIENYHKNFEIHEFDVFTDFRVEKLEKTIDYIMEIMITKYSRNLDEKYKQDNVRCWLEVLK